MKNKNILLLINTAISSFLGIYFFSYDLFISLSLFLVGLIFIYGFFHNPAIWFHQSSHIIVGNMIGIIISVYELLKNLSGILGAFISNEKIPSMNYILIVYGIFCLILMKSELNFLEKAKNSRL